MKTKNDIINENRKELGLQSWREINEEIHQKLKQKKRIHPLEVVFLGVMLTLCGFMILYILEGIQWLLS